MAKLLSEIKLAIKTNVYTEQDFVEAFNLWMDAYINNPKAFMETDKSAHQHLAEKLGGKEPTYGDSATATLFAYCDKIKQN